MSPISSRKMVPPSQSSNLPIRWPVAPVKEPFSWPKSSLSIRLSGMAAQLTAMKGLARTVAVLPDGARDQLLAGAALAGDHHRHVARGHLADDLEDLLHDRGAADDALLVVLGVDGRLVLADRPQVGVGLQGVFGERQHPLRVEGLHDVVEGPELHRLDGRLRRAEGRHQDDELLRVGGADVLEGLQPLMPVIRMSR
jgi:hypothetical protein